MCAPESRGLSSFKDTTSSDVRGNNDNWGNRKSELQIGDREHFRVGKLQILGWVTQPLVPETSWTCPNRCRKIALLPAPQCVRGALVAPP